MSAVVAHKQQVDKSTSDLKATEASIVQLNNEPYNRDVDLDIDDLENSISSLTDEITESKALQVDEKTKLKIYKALGYYVDEWKVRERLVEVAAAGEENLVGSGPLLGCASPLRGSF